MGGFAHKDFTSKEEAKDFAKKAKGVIEGPFLDYDMNASYVVFYKEVR